MTQKKSRHSSFSNEAVGYRQTRLETLLREELKSLIYEAADPALGGVRILDVCLSPDGGHARIGYAVVAVGQTEQTEQVIRYTVQSALVRATPFLRAKLAQRMDLKKLPQLGFTFVGLAEEPCE